MIPALVQWEVTDRCNLRCSHCYHLNTGGCITSGAELKDADMFRIAELLVRHRLFFVTLTGGEPLVRKGLVVDLTQYLADHGLVLSLNTNLLLLDEQLLARLAVHRFLISCPVADPTVYAAITRVRCYDQFERRLALLVERKANFTVNMVVSKLNRDHIRRTAVRMAELGVKRFAATPASVNARQPNFEIILDREEVRTLIGDLMWAHDELGLEVDIMESVPKCLMPERAFEQRLPFTYRTCHAGRRNGTIGANGQIRPCSHNPNSFGNILEEGIIAIWDRIGRWRESSGNFYLDCLSCDAFSFCGGGCRVDAAIREGNTNARHPNMVNQASARRPQPKPVSLTSGTKIRPARTFQARREDDLWLVAPGSARNIIKVNDSLYKFLVATRSLSEMTVADLAAHFGTSFDDSTFLAVVSSLTEKNFFLIRTE